MPRKSSTTRSSAASSAAAAAAALSNSPTTGTPVFTSFAAATAQVLASQQPTEQQQQAVTACTSTEWDDNAIALIKKLNKRDATTKYKGLLELKSFLQASFQARVDSDAGYFFLSSWQVIFPSLVNDPDLNIRLEALHIIDLIVSNMGKKSQQSGVLEQLFPLWVSCTGDDASVVSQLALQCTNRIFPTQDKKMKVLKKYHKSIITFCNQTLDKLSKATTSGSNSQAQSIKMDCLKLIATLKWVLSVTNDLQIVEPIFNSEKDLFALVEKLSNKYKLSNLPVEATIQLATIIIQLPQPDDKQVKRIVKFAFRLGKQSNPLTWDLMLNLLFNAPHAVLPEMMQLTSIISRDISKGDLNTLSALLPILATVHKTSSLPEMLSLAKQLLSPLNKKLFTTNEPTTADNPDSQQPSNSTVAHLFPVYVETVAFIISIVKKSNSDSSIDQNDDLDEWVQSFGIPILNAFIIGNLPPVRNETKEVRRRDDMKGANSSKVMENLKSAISSLCKTIMSDERNMQAMSNIINDLITNLSKSNRDQVINRFSHLLDSLSDPLREGALAKIVLDQFLLLFNESRHEGGNSKENGTLKDYGILLSNGISLCSTILCKQPGYMIFNKSKSSSTESSLKQNISALIGKLMPALKDIFESIVCNGKLGDKSRDDVAFGISNIYSWTIWLTSSVGEDERISRQIFDDLYFKNSTSVEQSRSNYYQMFKYLLVAHNSRQNKFESFVSSSNNAYYITTSCPSIRTDLFEHITMDIASKLKQDKDLIKSASPFISRVIGVVPISAKCTECILEMIVNNTETFSTVRCESTDDVIISFLRSTYVKESAFREEFMTIAFNRATLSKRVLDEYIALISSLSISEVNDIVSTSVARMKQTEDRDELEKIGKLYATLCSQLGERDVQSSVSVCKLLFSSSVNVIIIQSVLEYISSPAYLFGEDSKHAEAIIISVLSHRHDQLTATLLSSLSNFISIALTPDTLPFTSSLCTSLTNAVLNASLFQSSMVDIIKLVCKFVLTANNEKVAACVFQSITSELELSVPITLPGLPMTTEERELKKKKFSIVPVLISECVSVSNDHMLKYLQPLVKQISTLIRRDITSEDSFGSIDVICSLLSSMRKQNFDHGYHWLEESLDTIINAVRKTLGVPRGLSKSDIKKLEHYGAMLLFYSLRVFNNAKDDDKRFWRLRGSDVLQDIMKSLKAGNNLLKGDADCCKRILWLCELVNALLISENEDTSKDVVHDSNVMQDEIYHLGAWSTVYILPTLSNENDPRDNEIIRNAHNTLNFKGNSQLILKAAERGVLLSKEGAIPVPYKDIYNLTPFLKSKHNHVRKSVFILIAHTIGIDMPERINEEFPKNGFGSEEEEVEFANDMIPHQLQGELEWDEVNNEVANYEIGYFLAWRLLLDVMHGEEVKVENNGNMSGSGGGEDEDEEEEISVRRIASLYLRIHPIQFRQFLTKCVDVIVDGSENERHAAADGAQQALQLNGDQQHATEQGIQLAHRQQRDEVDNQREKPSDDVKNSKTNILNKEDDEDKLNSDEYQTLMEAQVGQAAGVAFARALQRVPALSRDSLSRADRGAFQRVEEFVRRRVSPVLIAAEIARVHAWASVKPGSSTTASPIDEFPEDGAVDARGSVASREVRASYTFSDVTLEIGVRMPEAFPLRCAIVEARSRVGMSESRWRKTVLVMTTLLQIRDGSIAEAVQVWKKSLDGTFKGKEECPICYSVLHMSTAAFPRKQCRTCKKKFHSECLVKWFTKSNSSACPLCRSAF